MINATRELHFPPTPSHQFFMAAGGGCLAALIFFIASQVTPDPTVAQCSFVASLSILSSTPLLLAYLYLKTRQKDPLVLTACLGLFILGIALTLLLDNPLYCTLSFLAALNASRLLLLNYRESKEQFTEALHRLLHCSHEPQESLCKELLESTNAFPSLLEQDYLVDKLKAPPLSLAITLENKYALTALVALGSPISPQHRVEPFFKINIIS